MNRTRPLFTISRWRIRVFVLFATFFLVRPRQSLMWAFWSWPILATLHAVSMIRMLLILALSLSLAGCIPFVPFVEHQAAPLLPLERSLEPVLLASELTRPA